MVQPNSKRLLVESQIGTEIASLVGGKIPEAQIPARLGTVELSATNASALAAAAVDPAGILPKTFAAAGLLSAQKLRLPINTGLLTAFQPGHGWTSANTPLSITDDATDSVMGSQSVKVVTTTANDPASLQKTGLSLNATGKTFRVWFKVDGLADLSEVLLYAGDTALANNYSWVLIDGFAVSAQQFTKDGEWISMTVNWGDATIAGSPDRTALQNVRVRARSKVGTSATVRFNGVSLVDEPGAYPNGVVSVTFDDSKVSQATEGQTYLDRYGYGGTYYTICGQIGQTNYMTMPQLRRIADFTPSEISAHAFTKANHDTTFPNLAPDVLDAELRNMHVWLQANGFKGGDHIAYPQGAFTASVLDKVGKYYQSGRTILSKIETLRPAHPLRLRSISVSNVTTVASVKAAIDKAYANKGWLILTFHDIVTTPTVGTEYSIANYREIIDYLATKQIPVQPVGEVLSVIAPATAPAPTPIVAADISGAIVHAALGNTAGKLHTVPRGQVAAAGTVAIAGRTDITCFTPAVTMTITRITAQTGTAWTGHTLARMGLYTVDAAGAATLVARTASDTSLFIAADTMYQRVMDATGGYPTSYQLMAGQRYAIGIIGVGQSAGQLRGASTGTGLAQRSPVMGGTLLTAQTDLPTTGTITAASTFPYSELAA